LALNFYPAFSLPFLLRFSFSELGDPLTVRSRLRAFPFSLYFESFFLGKDLDYVTGGPPMNGRIVSGSFVEGISIPHSNYFVTSFSSVVVFLPPEFPRDSPTPGFPHTPPFPLDRKPCHLGWGSRKIFPPFCLFVIVGFFLFS